MKAAVFRCVGSPLEVVNLNDPEPLENEVVLRVGRCGICGSDLHMTEPGSINPKPGQVIGHEISGEVVALGKGVSRLKIGDRVAALPIKGCGRCAPCLAGEFSWCVEGVQILLGGYAQYARAGANECLVLPSNLSMADGSLVEPLAVALHGVRMAQGLPGSTVRVLGGGPIGLGAIFWARRFGARRVEAVEGNAVRADMARTLGADDVFPPDAEANAGRPVAPPDFVIECVGRPGLLDAAVAQVRSRGTVISLGFCMTQEPFAAHLAARREVTIKFPLRYTLDDYALTIETLASGAVEPRAMVTDVFTLDALPARFEALREPGRQCKVMIDPWLEG